VCQGLKREAVACGACGAHGRCAGCWGGRGVSCTERSGEREKQSPLTELSLLSNQSWTVITWHRGGDGG
jgi:hypothetical protein